MAQQSKINSAPEATRGPATSFSGTVWVTTLVGPNAETDCIVSSVTFDPKARTFWHTHPNGQLLVVTKGIGFYQEKGKPARLIREGDSVTIPPMVEHWHGAGPNGTFTHTAINPNVSKGGAVNWLQAVTDEEYRIAH
ncbi:cupin domain-containing protein [Spirosoma sordidisoli]|uniref:Cupin domain-containing protein n=2 Tax=Cytophagaceae TaxID=89373 RepID=A0A4Q2UEX0_9BACT|nr:cupin domain-containing protein [Spirosoma sordidisoli]